MMMKTTCPLDCYDACGMVYENGTLKADVSHPVTTNYLCKFMNVHTKHEPLKTARVEGKNVSLEQALETLSEKLRHFEGKKSLYFKGNGNFGVMQNAPAAFFEHYGSEFTKGTLCDGAGEAGVVQGRGLSLSLPHTQIEKSEVVVVWGRNPAVTNTHLMHLIEGKTLIVIDPVKTKTAQKADIHVQIRPHTDIYLAFLLSRFIYMADGEDEMFINAHTEDCEEYVDLIRGHGIKKLFALCGVNIDDVNQLLHIMENKKVVFLVGVGVQKYRNGAETLRAIDSLAAMRGMFGKEGSGVAYLGSSSEGFTLPFLVKPKKRVSKPTVDFGEYDLVFIQGANPMRSNPNTGFVKEGLEGARYVVYYGTEDNDTAKMANIVIPSCDFLAKEDIRFSYFHEYIGLMPKQIDASYGISEYDLSHFLLQAFDKEPLKSEQSYIDALLKENATQDENGHYLSKSYDNIPYENGFLTDDEKFYFLDEYDEESVDDEGFYLITSKSSSSLNSRYKPRPFVYIHPDVGIKEGAMVSVKSQHGTHDFEVKLSETLRDDCVLIYAGSAVNYLTPAYVSYEGDSAVFQEVKVEIDVCQADLEDSAL